jgi:DNA-binding transcriptional regulator PaaX
MNSRKKEKIVDLKEIEMKILGIVHCDGIVPRMGYIHIWDMLKMAQEWGISERRAREAINYLESRGFLETMADNFDEYRVTQSGEEHLAKLLAAHEHGSASKT